SGSLRRFGTPYTEQPGRETRAAAQSCPAGKPRADAEPRDNPEVSNARCGAASNAQQRHSKSLQNAATKTILARPMGREVGDGGGRPINYEHPIQGNPSGTGGPRRRHVGIL